MRKGPGFVLIVPLLSAAAFLAMPATPAVAQGCTEQLAQNFLAGWSHDLPVLIPLFTEDVVYEDTTVHAVLHGKEALRGFAEGWFKAFPDLSFTVTSAPLISEDGGRMSVAWQVTGTQRGDMPGMPASNKIATVVGVSLIECTGGKIKHSVDYWDMATTMRQLGFLPPATN
jgi:steroid delta-isomerase-like uncharacterized protein